MRHPNYIDCFLRLSSCACARGSSSDGAAWLKRGIEVDPKSADLRTSLGNLHLREGDYIQALLAHSFPISATLRTSPTSPL